jgi:hypothetical protein
MGQVENAEAGHPQRYKKAAALRSTGNIYSRRYLQMSAIYIAGTI